MNSIPLNIDFQQVLLHLFNVAILFAILYFLIYKPVKKFMDKRLEAYKEMDADAQNKVREAQELKAGYEAKLKQADEEIAAMKKDASKAAAQSCDEAMEKARQQAQQIVDDARKQAQAQRDSILAETGDKITELAKEAAKKLVFDNSSDAFDSFLDAAGQKK